MMSGTAIHIIINFYRCTEEGPENLIRVRTLQNYSLMSICSLMHVIVYIINIYFAEATVLGNS